MISRKGEKEDFMASKGMKKIKEGILQCRGCKLGLPTNCRVIGKGSLSPTVLFVGAAPGPLEVKTGVAFSGPEGKQLEHMVKALKLTSDQWAATYYLKCPLTSDISVKEVESCSIFFGAQVRLLNPKAIVILGEKPAEGVTKRPLKYGEIREWTINRWIIKVLSLEELVDSVSNQKKQKGFLDVFRRKLERNEILQPIY